MSEVTNHGKSKKEEARTCRLPCPEARPSAYTEGKRQAAPIWARSVGLLCGLKKLVVFGTARSRSYAKLFWLNNNGRFGVSNAASVRRKIIGVNQRESAAVS
jgi:hypothetical protein